MSIVEIATLSAEERAASIERVTLVKEARPLVIECRVSLPPLLVPDDNRLESSSVFVREDA